MFKKFFKEDVSKYQYLLTPQNTAKYKRNQKLFACIPLLLIPYFIVTQSIQSIAYVPMLMLIGYKVPYILLSLQHTQHCNDVVYAIPLWINYIYALIEKYTIHNAIVNSYGKTTPLAIKQDLKEFIEKIERNPEDKDAYLNFLSRYKIEGVSDIMLKLFEFRKLSKDKLKYEIHNLNQSMGKIESMKRQNQFKKEVFYGDTATCFVIFIPCIYMTVISLMPSLFTV